jgi:ATP/maltotriose-dependent transcriptional regulator MalT/two-component SAPR family response regulator
MARNKGFVLQSKLQAPQIKAKTLHRQRLIDVLTQNMDKKLISICAGAGYGKTTLLSQFISTTKFPYTYYHLEKSDAAPAVFFSYLIAGIRTLYPDVGAKTERLGQFFNAPQRYVNIIVGTFINEIIEHVTDDLYVILEDYHALYPSEQIEAMLVYLLDHLPEHLHLIITSRVALPFSVSQMRARGEIIELGNQQLRFTKDEIRELFGMAYSGTLKESELDWIREHSEGWPTSLRLILQSADYLEDEESSGYIRRILEDYYRSQSNIFNYFAQEIYNKESKSTRQFLVDCATLEWLTPELCDATTKRRDSAEILEDLTTRNAFLVRMPGVGYRFHNLFRDFLTSKITDKRRTERIYRRAGDYYLKDSRPEEALKFYLQAEHYTKASTIIQNIGPELIAQGKSGILCSYIEAIPKPFRQQRPSLLMAYAQSLMYVGRPDEAKNNCLRAVQLFKKQSRVKKKYADALYALGGMYLNLGKFDAAKRWFKRALDVCPVSSRLTKAAILNSIGSVHTAVGGKQLGIATKYFQQALKIAQRNEFKSLEASILNNWGMNEFRSGNLGRAYSVLSKIVPLLEEHYTPGCGAGFFNASRFGMLSGYSEEAQSILDAGTKICSTYDDVWSMSTLWYGYALLYHETGDLSKAKGYAAKALEMSERLGHVQGIIKVLNEVSHIELESGNISDAERNLSKAWVLMGSKTDIEAIPLLLTDAKLRIAQGKYIDAESTLVDALSLSRKLHHRYYSYILTQELCKLNYMKGNVEKAFELFDEAVTLSRTNGYDYLLLKMLKTEAWVLQYVRKENKNAQYVVSAIKQSDSGIHWVDIRFFGVPRIFIDDSDVPDSAWRTVKAKKLFCYLLLHRTGQTTRETLIEALWPDATPSGGSDNLRKAIQYVRETVKPYVDEMDAVVMSSKGIFYPSAQSSVWIDSEEFERLMNKAKQVEAPDVALKTTLEQALALYHGDFATGWYEPWAEEQRRHYQSLYEECLNMIARYYADSNKPKEAVQWFKRLIELDFFDEEYHRGLMKMYAVIGRGKEVQQDFEKLKTRLKKELKTEPQAETTRLYNTLIRK